MKTFRIATFLEVEGPELAVDLNARRVTGFCRLRIMDGGTTLEFDASPRAETAPVDVPAASTLSWLNASHITVIDANTIELREDRNAFVSFHWPNPLTPRAAGLFFRLAVEKTKDGNRIRFRRGTNADLPFGHGFFLDRSNTWDEFFLSTSPDQRQTPAQWRASAAGPRVDAELIQEGALFTGEAASLVDNRPGHNQWEFGWRFATGSDAISRAIAAVKIDNREDFAVNVRALRLEERAELRPRPLRWDRDLILLCGSVRAAGPATSWAVDWLNVPTFEKNVRKDHFSLRAFWQELARHWALGLRSLRSRNSLTFVPTDIDRAVDALGVSPWIFRFRARRVAGEWQSALATIGRTDSLALRFELASLLGTGGKASHFNAVVTARSGAKEFESITEVTEQGLSSLIDFRLGKPAGEVGEFLVGGLILDAGELQSGSLRIDWRDVRTQLGQPPVAVRFELTAAGGAPRPGTEDPERGFESENDLLGRERPLVIDLLPKADIATEIQVLEVADAGRSRVLEVLVRNKQTANAGQADVVVIDPAPLLIARVKTGAKEAQANTILASYRDDGERPPGWELHTDTGAMTLVLPPQAIGEEMIKGKLEVREGNRRTKVPFTDRPFDFRLSPPARLVLDRTDIDTARAAAPWSLRRLLDRREGVVGLKLDKARFELLYGLTTRIEEIEGLRIAEQDAFVGRVPIAPAVRDRAQERLSSTTMFDESEIAYAKNAVSWIGDLFSRPAQLPVFRDFANRERLVLREGVTFDFRPTRQTVHPIRIDDASRKSVPPPAGDDNRLRLRGGVDFPFESENIYNIAVDNEQKATVGQPQGSVSGLVFGALGGSGGQQASFDEGRTIVISDTTQGRLNSLTLIRIGRIAMLWHHARHVIVYERTTRTAPRYVHEQPDSFEGLNALRKVKEYIEITQRRRGYPDFAAGAEERPMAGPVTGCTFETQVIPVKSSWGHDIDEGWVMALRGPLEELEPPFYPVPKIFLELARAESKGAGAVNHLASDPSQLLFFTTTRPGLGADTDRWPAWPDIDFPLTRKPAAPKVRYLPGFSGTSHQPDAARHDYGQGRFTIDVTPPEEASNLLHGRPGNGLEARVRNVSFARGGPATKVRSAVEDAVGAKFAEAEAQIGDALAEVAQHLERIAERNAGATVAEIAGLRDEARAVLDDALAKAGELHAAVSAGDTLIGAKTDNWVSIQTRGLADSQTQLDAAKAVLRQQFTDGLKAVVQRMQPVPNVPLPKDEALAAVANVTESLCRQALQRVEGVPFLLAEVRDRLDAEIAAGRQEIADEFARVSAAWRAELISLQKRFEAESPVALQSELYEVLVEGRARVAAFGAGFGRLVKTRLGPLFGDVPGDGGAVGKLTEAVEALTERVVDMIDATIDVIPPFDLRPPDWEAIAETLEQVFPDVETLFDDVADALVATLAAPLDDWQKIVTEQRAALETLCRTQTDRLTAAVNALNDPAGALDAIIGDVVGEWETAVGNRLETLRDEAKARLKDAVENNPVAQSLQGAINRAQFLDQEVRAKIETLRSQLDSAASVRELAETAQALTNRAGAGLRRIGEQVEQAVANELRNAAQGAEAAALELTRALAEGPVTDTLRCTRDWVGYYYDAARDALDVTRAAGVFNDLGGSVLNSLAAQVPFDRIRDRLLAQLGGFDVNKLFPDFAGLKLEHLLSGMTIPNDPLGEYDWIRMRHGFDRARLTAWSEIAIDKQFDDSPELFTLPPVALSVLQPRFTATSRIEVDVKGARAQRTRAELTAHWQVTLSGQPIMTIEKGGLFFDSDGGFRFDFESENLQLAPVLQFVTDALRNLLPQEEGLTLTPILPGGISVELSLPLPDIGTGAFTLTGITLCTHFDLLVAGGFEVRTGLWLSRPERPFGMAVLFLGGGGWFGVDVRYKPPEEFETRVSVGLAAGAFVALNFGVARGSAGVLLTAGLDFYRNWLQRGSQDLAISIGILVWGEFSILSIVSAYLRVVLRIEYRNGEMTGYGSVSVSIKICWCFTLRVSSQIRLPFKSNKSQSSSSRVAATREAPALPPPAATDTRTAVGAALDAHFANLEV